MKIKDRVLSRVYEILYFAKKKSPELLLAGGTIALAGSVASMWNTKEKLTKAIDIHEEKITDLHDIQTEEKLSEKEVKKETTKIYISTGVNVTKVFAPTVGLFLGGMSMIFASHLTMKKRNLGLIAAYNTLDTAFKAYRKRVADELGEAEDRHFLYGTEREEYSETIVGPDGKKKKTKGVNEFIVDTKDFSRIFDRSLSDYHRADLEGPYAYQANLMYLRGMEQTLTAKLSLKHQLTLNDVYEALRMPKSYAGSFVGWRDLDHGGKSGMIRFGIDDPESCTYIYNSGKVLGEGDYYEYAFVLNFNIDGIILDDKFDDISGTELYS